MLEHNPFGVIFLQPCFGSVLVGEDLEMIGIAERFSLVASMT